MPRLAERQVNFCSILIFLCICCLPQPTALDLFRVNWLRLYNKHTNKTSKGERGGSASRLDSSLFEEGWEEGALKKVPGGTPLYKPYRYVPPQRVGFLRRFGLKTILDFAQFGLEASMVFEKTTGV